MINVLKQIFSNISAKPKKAFGVIVGIVIAAIVFLVIFSDFSAIIGTVISIGVVGAIGFGVYYWLDKIDELPN
ncbi:MAG: hypothetical protein ACFFDW_13170 [Candidatus Thorarchaeota archaeon]